MFFLNLEEDESDKQEILARLTTYCPTEEEVNSVIDVLDVNAFEIRGNEFSIRGVYPLTAMMNQTCNPNTQNCIGKVLYENKGHCLK